MARGDEPKTIDEIPLQNVLLDGGRRGLPPNEIAAGVQKWHRLTYDYGQGQIPDEESEDFFRRARVLDRETGKALESLRRTHVSAFLSNAFDDVTGTERESFARAYDAAGGDPTKLDNEDHARVAEQLNAIARDPVYRRPGRETPIFEIKVGTVQLGTFWARPLHDEENQADVFVSYWDDDGDKQGRRVRIQIPTEDDVAAALEQNRADVERQQRAVDDTADFIDPKKKRSFWENVGRASSSGGEISAGRLLELQEAELRELRTHGVDLQQAGLSVLLTERVTDAVRDSDFARDLGDRGFFDGFVEDMVRGFTKFGLNTKLAANVLAGDDEDVAELSEVLKYVDSAYPGSTNARFRGGVGGFVSDTGEVLGNVLPTVALALTTGGESTAAQIAARTTVLGSMAPNAFGGAAHDSLQTAAAREEEAVRARLAGDEGLAIELMAEASRIRDDLVPHALRSTAVELGTELVFRGDELFKRGIQATAGRRIRKGVVENAIEEALAEAGQQQIALTGLGEDRFSVGQIARASAIGGLIGGGIQTLGIGRDALVQSLRSDPDATQPPVDGPESLPDATEPAPDATEPAPVEQLETTPATPEDPFGTVAETDATIEEQANRVVRGSKPAALLPGRTAEEAGQVIGDRNLVALETDAGALLVRPEAVGDDGGAAIVQAANEGNLGGVLGYGVPARPQAPDRAVVLRTRDGLEVEAVAADSATEATIRQALGARAEEGDSVTVETPDQLLEARVAQEEQTLDPVTETPITMGDVARTAGSARINLPGEEAAQAAVTTSEPEPAAPATQGEPDRSRTAAPPRAPARPTRPEGRLQSLLLEVAGRQGADEQVADSIAVALAGAEGNSEISLANDVEGVEIAEGEADTIAAARAEGLSPDQAAVRALEKRAQATSSTRLLQAAQRLQPAPEPSQNPAPRNGPAVEQKHVRNSLRQFLGRAGRLVTDRVRTYANLAEFLQSDYARGAEFTPEELEAMAGAERAGRLEGFYDGLTGDVVLFLEGVQVRPGETPARAVARVLLHETIGHGGLARLLSDPKFEAQFEELAARVENEFGAELEAIAEESGYGVLAGDRNGLVMEWFARQVEGAGAQLGLDGWAAKIWDAFKSLCGRCFSRFRKAPDNTEIRQLIGRAAKAWRNGTAAPATPGGIALEAERVRFSLGGTRVRHTEGQPFRVNNLNIRAILTGSPLPRSFARVVTIHEQERAALDESSAILARDLRAAIEAYAERSGQPETAVYQRVHDALEGQAGGVAALVQLDPVLGERVRVARNHLDNLSAAIISTLPAGRMRDTLQQQMGTWMRRSYAAFDPDSGWNFDNLQAAALDGREINGEPAVDIFNAGRDFLIAENPNATPAEIEAMMRDLMDRETFLAIMGGGSKVRKEVSSLLVRQEIPEPVRRLMGEERNPVHRFSRSTQLQSNFLNRHQEQIALRNLGLQQGLFSDRRGGVFTQEIPGGELGLAWSPLRGLWTTPQLWQAMQKTNVGVSGLDLGAMFWEGMRWVSNEAKLNRVALNPDSWMVNVLGNVAAVVQTGDVFYRSFFGRVHEAARMRLAGRAKDGDVYDATVEGVIDAQRALMARLAASGVTTNDLTQAELRATMPRHLLQFLEQSEASNRASGAAKGAIYGQGAARGLGPAGRAAGAAVGGAVGAIAGYTRIDAMNRRIAQLVMVGPDQIGRLVGFLGNYETAIAAGMNQDQAYEWAVDRTNNTFPDYSKLPDVVRSMSRAGVLGSFIAFQWEVYRNTIWNLRYAAQELRSGNAAMVARGIRRIMGTASLGILSAGGIAALWGASGANDERNKRWRRWFGAPWERHALLAFTRYDDDGVRYFNSSYLVPQATILELGRAALDGDNVTDAVGNVFTQAWQQFAGSSVHLDPLVQAFTGHDGRGYPISTSKSVAGQAFDRISHAGQTILEPGWATKLERLTYAARGQPRRTRTFHLDEEALRLVGVRSYSRTWDSMLKRTYNGRLWSEYQRIRTHGNRILSNNTPGARKRALEQANREIDDLNRQLLQFEADQELLGIPKDVRAAARKDSQVPQAGFSNVKLNQKGDKFETVKRKRTGTRSSSAASRQRAALGL